MTKKIKDEKEEKKKKGGPRLKADTPKIALTNRWTRRCRATPSAQIRGIAAQWQSLAVWQCGTETLTESLISLSVSLRALSR